MDTLTIEELERLGQLELGKSVNFESWWIYRWHNSIDKFHEISGLYWIYNRTNGLYLRKDGTEQRRTGWGEVPRELDGYFPDLETVIDHLYVFIHSRPESAGSS